MATHSSILAWKIPWTEDLVDYSSWGLKESDTTEVTEHAYTTSLFIFLFTLYYLQKTYLI